MRTFAGLLCGALLIAAGPLRAQEPFLLSARVRHKGHTSFELRWGLGPAGAWLLGARLEGRDVWIAYERGSGARLGLDHSGVLIAGRGAPGKDSLEWPALVRAAAERNRDLALAAPLLGQAPGEALLGVLRGLLARLAGPGSEVELQRGPFRLPPAATAATTLQRVPRAELESALRRGLLRALEILDGDAHAVAPPDGERRSGAGRLLLRAGRRILLLDGTARAIGAAHGALLREEVRRNIEAALFVAGFVYTVERGRWFLGEIRSAWSRLAPHIEAGELEEMDALADAAGRPREEVRLANVFPALFHCSGFALAGRATVGGKLYHGRVLDYMTRIGLQRNAALMIVSQPGRHGFANVGYAGFIGSVSGMNEQRIAIGEMGGGGEGRWDGVPMSLLIRRALERCGSVEEVVATFKEAPRTCEYFYVVSDGNTRSALGVAAWPARMEFIGMGAAHPLLPEAIEDAVLLSAGGRYRELVRRVRARYGRIDRRAAIALMAPGVSTDSALHNVLFAPEDLELWVAHAGIRANTPAGRGRYESYDLRALLARARRPGGDSSGAGSSAPSRRPMEGRASASRGVAPWIHPHPSSIKNDDHPAARSVSDSPPRQGRLDRLPPPARGREGRRGDHPYRRRSRGPGDPALATHRPALGGRGAG